MYVCVYFGPSLDVHIHFHGSNMVHCGAGCTMRVAHDNLESDFQGRHIIIYIYHALLPIDVKHNVFVKTRKQKTKRFRKKY